MDQIVNEEVIANNKLSTKEEIKRSYRRHHAKHLKNKRSMYSVASKNDRHNGVISHTPATCSCWMCGNPRKFFKEKTKQEKSFDQLSKIK